MDTSTLGDVGALLVIVSILASPLLIAGYIADKIVARRNRRNR